MVIARQHLIGAIRKQGQQVESGRALLVQFLDNTESTKETEAIRKALHE